MNTTNERVLNNELQTYLRLLDMPLPLAVWAAWVSRAVTWQGVYMLSASARQVYEALVPWFVQHPDGKLLRAQEDQADFIVQGIVIMDGRPYGVTAPKVVLATASIQPEGTTQACVSIEAAAKIGALSRRSARNRVSLVCEAAAGEIIAHLSAEVAGVE